MITAVVMIGGTGEQEGPVTWVQGARRAATQDLLKQLAQHSLVERVILISPELEGLATAAVTTSLRSDAGPIHAGQLLAHVVEQFQIERLLYFGGGSAPLLSDALLDEIVTQLAQANQLLVTNNRYASDWAGVVPASILAAHTTRLPKDNMLGWVLTTEAGLPVWSPPAAAATRLDIDTPTDLLTLSLHPDVKSKLRRYLAPLPLDTGRLRAALSVLARPASRVFICGRIGPDVWSALNKATHCYLRVLAEERGMVSSGRQARAEVYSLLAEHLVAVGLDHFFTNLARWTDAAFIDTRVLLAHHGLTPTDNSRFASDLGLVEQVQEPWLRDFTTCALASSVPVILGGHSLVSGDMLAFCEIL